MERNCLPGMLAELRVLTADPKSSLIAKMMCCPAVPCSFQERAKVTASVVDIESDAHTVLIPATVSDRGSGNYEVRRQQGQAVASAR